MRLYNTLTRKKEEFKPLQKDFVGVYICGPTVYNYAHIGNMSSYLFADLLIRYLKYSGYKVKSVMNITDIEDKIINALKKEKNLNLPGLISFTEHFSKEFLRELSILGVKNIDIFPKATDYIPEMVEMIETLIEKDLAYLSDDGSVYYKIKNFKNYGKLSGICNIKKENLKTKDCVEYQKEDLADFVLWRAHKKEDGDIWWSSPWGKGRPGWHIECSAMSIKNLGASFDIHLGAVDLICPHHENEIAQSEGATGQKFVNYWMHREHLMVEGKKMSKSLDNFYILSDISKKNISPLAFRYLILTNHYRLNLNFTFQSLEAAVNSLKKIHNFIDRLDFVKSEKNGNIEIKLLISQNKKEFKNFLDDDLNVAKAIASLFDFISRVNALIDKNEINKNQALEILEYLKEIDLVWGFIFSNSLDGKEIEKAKTNAREPMKEIEELIELRNNYRQKKEWQKADEIRDKVAKLGFVLIDKDEETIAKPLI